LSLTSTAFAAKEYYPFKTTLGIVPEEDLDRIVFKHVERVDRVEGNESDFSRKERVDGPSLFWHYFTPQVTSLKISLPTSSLEPLLHSLLFTLYSLLFTVSPSTNRVQLNHRMTGYGNVEEIF
jgi:hypothetical protein